MEKPLRIFIALDLSDSFRAAVDARLRPLRAKFSQGVKWDDPSKFHITLAFLGDTEPSSLPAVKQACANATANARSFSLRFDHPGAFPPKGMPAVLWIGSAEQPALLELAKRVRAGLRASGVAHDKKPFRPHLTIARLRDHTQNAMALLDEFNALDLKALPAQSVKWVTIYQSELSPRGAVYTALARFEF